MIAIICKNVQELRSRENYNFIVTRVDTNKRKVRMLANARKDHSIPLSRLLYFLLLHRALLTRPNQTKQLSTVAILGFLFGLYHVVVLSFPRSNQPCFIVMFLFLADQIFYRSYVYRQHFRLRSLASL